MRPPKTQVFLFSTLVFVALCQGKGSRRDNHKGFRMGLLQARCDDGVCTYPEIFLFVADSDPQKTWSLLYQYFCVDRDPHCPSQNCQVRLDEEDLLYASCDTTSVASCMDNERIDAIYYPWTYKWKQLREEVRLSCLMDDVTLPRLYNQTLQTFGEMSSLCTEDILNDYVCLYKNEKCPEDQRCAIDVSYSASGIIVTSCTEDDESSEEEEPRTTYMHKFASLFTPMWSSKLTTPISYLTTSATKPYTGTPYFKWPNPYPTTTANKRSMFTWYTTSKNPEVTSRYTTEPLAVPSDDTHQSRFEANLVASIGATLLGASLIAAIAYKLRRVYRLKKSPKNLKVLVLNRPLKPVKPVDPDTRGKRQTRRSTRRARYSHAASKLNPKSNYRAQHVGSKAQVPTSPMSAQTHLPTRPTAPALSTPPVRSGYRSKQSSLHKF